MGGGKKKWIKVERVHCPFCKTVCRVLPDNLDRFKQYDNRIISYAQNDLTVFSWDLKYEDYPCESTIKRWGSQ